MMIDLKRLNGHPITVNSDLIKFVEAIPDTAVLLVTGERLLVRESAGEVVERIIAYRSVVLAHAWPDAVTALSAAAVIKHAAPDQPCHDHA